MKKGKFTLNVTSDDKTIEKKDRNVSEPIQFYSGRDRMLYELVVWTVDKNKATGYLSTPKECSYTGYGQSDGIQLVNFVSVVPGGEGDSNRNRPLVFVALFELKQHNLRAGPDPQWRPPGAGAVGCVDQKISQPL